MNTPIKMSPERIAEARSGKKKATTRLGLKPFQLGPAIFYDPAGTDSLAVTIHQVTRRTWLEVKTNFRLAALEGCQYPWDLSAALAEIYGPQTDETEFTTIEFTVVPSPTK